MQLHGEPLPPDLEAAVVATIPADLLLAWMRAEAGLADRVFAGFRQTRAGLKSPVVRLRLRQELSQHPTLAEHLWLCWSETHPDALEAVSGAEAAEASAALPEWVARWGLDVVRLALLADEREDVRALNPEVPTPPPEPCARPAPAPPEERPGEPEAAHLGEAARLREQLRAARDDLAQQRKEVGRLQGRLEEAQRAAEHSKAAADDSRREADDARRAGERHERHAERAQKAMAALEAQLKESRRDERRAAAALETHLRDAEAKARAQAQREATMPAGEAWLRAARELVRQGQAQSAVNLLAHLARDYPQALAVREALAEAYQGVGAVPAAVTEWCRVSRARRDAGDVVEALRLATRALGLAPNDEEARRCLRELAAEIERADGLVRPEVERQLDALRRESPTAGRVARELLEPGAGQSAGGSQGRRARITLDAPVEWPGNVRPFTASLRRVIEAIDANDEALVARVRQALALMQSRDSAAHTAVLAALARHDESYRSVLVRRTRPVVVDGSNVAWRGREQAGRPALAQIQAVRRELRGLGYFPIRVYVDAALVHQIDRRSELERLAAGGEVILAEAGRDADEEILRDARETGCPVVTNDRMLEHDPEGEVRKLRFEMERDGARVREG